MSLKAQRKYYFDFLRIFSTFLVILGHICILNLEILPPSSFEWNVLNFYDIVAHISIPLFFMISGALFLSPDKPIATKEIYSKYILRLFVSYTFWSCIYALISRPASISAFLSTVVSGHYHMWFIPALIGCYIFIPVLRKIAESESVLKYYILLTFLCTFVISFVTPILAESAVPAISYAGELINTAYDNLFIRLVIGFTGYFVIGYYLYKTEFSKLHRRIIYIIGILSLIAAVGLSVYFSLRNGKLDVTMVKSNSPTKLLIGVAIFVFLKYNMNFSLSEKASKAVCFVSKCTFGVYLIHPLFIWILSDVLKSDALFINPLFSVPILTLAVFAVSFIFSAILNKIPFVNKYIV